jgi:Ni,Fe-hydrogenase I cytochrome b subunit
MRSAARATRRQGDAMHTAMEMLSRVAFGAASIVLIGLSLMLVGYGAAGVISSIAASWSDASDALLAAIGYVVIAIAVFDVAKYFVEEEVIRGREMRLTSEARRSLTKFISTISIAVFIEALVMVFQVGKNNVELLLYPTALLLTAILIVVGLGLYQRLAADTERKVEAKDKAKAEAEAEAEQD